MESLNNLFRYNLSMSDKEKNITPPLTDDEIITIILPVINS